MSIQITSTTRVTKDSGTGALRTWYDTASLPQPAKIFVPRTVARTVLEQSASLFNWTPALADLRDGNTTQGPNAYSVRFTQEFKGIPVDASEIVVNMYQDSRVHSVYNNYHYDIPQQLDPKQVKIDGKQARAILERIAARLKEHTISEPKLIVY